MKSTKHEREHVISLEAHYRIVDSMVRQRERLRKEVRLFKCVAIVFAGLFLLLAAAGCRITPREEWLVETCGPAKDTAAWMHCCLEGPEEAFYRERFRREPLCLAMLARRGAEGQ